MLPPPTARITSMPFSLQIFAPSLTLESFGFGSIPESSYTSNELKRLLTLSYGPVLFMLPPPYVNSTLLPYFDSSSLKHSI